MKSRYFILMGLVLVFTVSVAGYGLFSVNESIFPFEILQSSASPSLAIPPRYDLVRHFNNSRAAARLDGQWGYINETGNWVIEPRFQGALDFQDGLAPVKADGKWGYVNREGDFVVGPQYDRARSFREGRAAVKRAGRWAFLDSTGETVTPLRYDFVKSYRNAFAVVQKNNEKRFINRSGDTVFEGTYDDALSFSGGFAPVERDDLWGFIDREGDVVVEFRYQWASPYSDDHARVLTGSGWKFLTRDFEEVDRTSYELVGSKADSIAPVIMDEEWGFLHESGDPLVPGTSFEAVLPFRNGLAPVKKGSNWGYVDTSGDMVKQPTYDAAGQFHEGLARVKIDGRWGFLARKARRSARPKQKDTAAGERKADTDASLRQSLTDDYPEWFFPGGQRYISIGRGVLDRRWHLESTSPTESYGFDEVLYEVTKYPYQFPDSVQHEAAEELYFRSLNAVKKNGWLELNEALDDGFEQNQHDATHFHHYGNSSDTRVLVPGEPEYLIYYDQGKDQQLTGIMYLNSSLYGTGPQVGGNLTKWHYHRYSSEKCFREKLLIQHEAERCAEGTWQRRAPEMLHIWFIEHPQGSHGTRMEFLVERELEFARTYRPKLTN